MINKLNVFLGASLVVAVAFSVGNKLGVVEAKAADNLVVYSADVANWQYTQNATVVDQQLKTSVGQFNMMTKVAPMKALSFTTTQTLELNPDGDWKWEYLSLSAGDVTALGVDGVGVTSTKNSVNLSWGWLGGIQVTENDAAGAVTTHKTVSKEAGEGKIQATGLLNTPDDDVFLDAYLRKLYNKALTIDVVLYRSETSTTFAFNFKYNSEWGHVLNYGINYETTNPALMGDIAVAYGRNGSTAACVVDETHSILVGLSVTEGTPDAPGGDGGEDQAALDAAAAANVDTLIQALVLDDLTEETYDGAVTAYNAAKAAYDALNENAKALLTEDPADLTAAKAKIDAYVPPVHELLENEEGTNISTSADNFVLSTGATFNENGTMSPEKGYFDFTSKKIDVPSTVKIGIDQNFEFAHDAIWRYEYIQFSSSTEVGVSGENGRTLNPNSVSLVWGWTNGFQIIENDVDGQQIVKTLSVTEGENKILVSCADDLKDQALLNMMSYWLQGKRIEFRINVVDNEDSVTFTYNMRYKSQWGHNCDYTFSYTSENTALLGGKYVNYGRNCDQNNHFVDETHGIQVKMLLVGSFVDPNIELAAEVDELIAALILDDITVVSFAAAQSAYETAKAAYDALSPEAKAMLTEDPADLEVAKAKLDVYTAKVAAKNELDVYKDLTKYRDAQKTELQAAIAQGKTAIDAATDLAGVESALAAAKTAMDAIKTDAQLTAEEEENSNKGCGGSVIASSSIISLAAFGLVGLLAFKKKER